MTTDWPRPSPPVVHACLSALGCVAVVACQLAGLGSEAAFAKIFASTAFVVAALTAGALRSAWGRILLVGLALSWLGDVLLIGRGPTWFLAGLVAFLLAHIVYIAAFGKRGISRRWAAVALIPVAAVSLLVSAWLAPYVPAPMVTPVRLYTLAISLMLIAAIATRGAGATALIALGASCFYLSDIAVAARQFTQPVFPPYVWGLPLYYAGQIMLALSARHTPQATGSMLREGSG